MKEQNYSNHRMFYVPHHFVYLPLLGIFLFTGIYKIFESTENRLIWILFSIIIFLLIYLAIMLRQHYALGLQDRILRLEFRQRYFEIYGQRSENIEERLTFSQIAALRFAGDDEFKKLLEKTLKENLSANAIKKSITEWKADQNRV